MFLKSFNYETLGSTSSIADAINTQMIKDIELQIPDEAKLTDFKNQCEPVFHKIKSNINQIKILSGLRNTLLPKIMDGEVRIKI